MTAFSIFEGIFRNGWVWSSRYNVQLLMLIVVWGIHVYRGLSMSERKTIRMAGPVRAIFWFILIILILYGAVDTTEQFIYFQF